jgi:hypothetical protein
MEQTMEQKNNDVFDATSRHEEEGEQYRTCPTCRLCTREPRPEHCSIFRRCPYYLCWLRRTWAAVLAPLRRREFPREVRT